MLSDPKSLFCCGRERRKKARNVAGVQCIEDPHQPSGYREIRSPAEMTKLLTHKIAEQNTKCGICGEPMPTVVTSCRIIRIPLWPPRNFAINPSACLLLCHFT